MRNQLRESIIVQNQPTESDELNNLRNSLAESRRESKKLLAETEYLKTQVHALKGLNEPKEDELQDKIFQRKKKQKDIDLKKSLKEKTKQCEQYEEQVLQLKSELNKEKEETRRGNSQTRQLSRQTELFRLTSEETNKKYEIAQKEIAVSMEENMKLKETIIVERNRLIKMEDENHTSALKLKDCMKKIEDLQTYIAKVNKGIEDERENCKKMTNRLMILEKEKIDVEEKYFILKNDHSTLAKTEEMNKQIRNDIVIKEREFLSLDTEAKTLRLQNEEFQKQLNSIREVLSSLKMQLQTEKNNKAVIEVSMKELKARYASISQENIELQTFKASAHTRFKQLEDQLTHIRKLEGQETQQESIISEIKKHLKEAEERNKVLSESNRLLLMRLKREEETRKKQENNQ